MKRMTIVCKEEEKEHILQIFEDSCPFKPYTNQCGEDACCSECLLDNINFDIE